MKRRFVLCPDFNNSSVVLLFEKGDDQHSWSIRDYSAQGAVRTRYAQDFPESLQSISARFQHELNAPAVSVSDLTYWHALTQATNESLGLNGPSSASASRLSSRADKEDGYRTAFDVLDYQMLASLPKATKANDLERIFESSRSEDWVTWNMFRLLQRYCPETWWKHLVDLALQDNPSIVLPKGWQDIPTVSLWKCIPTPREYEAKGRARLRESGIPHWVKRAGQTGSVEGDSEIDISLHSDALTLFIEAKLGSDISLRTSYDPDRNQIVRNVDCLLDDARTTEPFFWMVVRDAGPKRAYTQLVHEYRRNPAILQAALPHRRPEVVAQVGSQIAIVLWRDLMNLLPKTLSDELSRSVYVELRTRVL